MPPCNGDAKVKYIYLFILFVHSCVSVQVFARSISRVNIGEPRESNRGSAANDSESISATILRH